MAKRRHKRRTHAAPAEDEVKVPKSMVMKMGDSQRQPTKALSALVRDFRQIMQPHTAAKLKERKSNKLKDFLVMAGPLGVTHFFIFSQSAQGNTTLRIARTPRGPTLYFRVKEYTLARDILKTQTRPHSVTNEELRTPPVLIMNGFSAEKTSDKEALLTSMFHNMIPPIDVSTTRLNTVSRALLISKDKETEDIYIRHFVITVKPTGSSRAVRKLNAAQQGRRAIPNLNAAADVADFMYDPGLSESEGEDEVIPTESKTKKAVKLVEVGPRLKLSLLKIEEGLCSGKTIYHATEKRSEKQAAALEKMHRERDALRAQRRKEQEENVRRKREEKAAKTSRTRRGIEKAKLKEQENGQGQESDGEDSGSDYEQDLDTMNDAELEAELAGAESDPEESD